MVPGPRPKCLLVNTSCAAATAAQHSCCAGSVLSDLDGLLVTCVRSQTCLPKTSGENHSREVRSRGGGLDWGVLDLHWGIYAVRRCNIPRDVWRPLSFTVQKRLLSSLRACFASDDLITAIVHVTSVVVTTVTSLQTVAPNSGCSCFTTCIIRGSGEETERHVDTAYRGACTHPLLQCTHTTEWWDGFVLCKAFIAERVESDHVPFKLST